MKKLKTYSAKASLLFAGITASVTTAMAEDFGSASDSIVDLISTLMTPALAIVGALGGVYSVILGMKFAKVEDPQEREKVKVHIRNVLVGFFLLFVLFLSMKLVMPLMKNWAAERVIQAELTNS